MRRRKKSRIKTKATARSVRQSLVKPSKYSATRSSDALRVGGRMQNLSSAICYQAARTCPRQEYGRDCSGRGCRLLRMPALSRISPLHHRRFHSWRGSPLFDLTALADNGREALPKTIVDAFGAMFPPSRTSAECRTAVQYYFLMPPSQNLPPRARLRVPRGCGICHTWKGTFARSLVITEQLFTSGAVVVGQEGLP